MSIDAALGRLGIQTGVCTSSTRPANPYEGQVIYETDTNNLRFWSGSAWESNKGAVISSAAPSSPAAGDIWYDSDDGRAYVYYDDGSSQQWVEFGAPPVAHGKILQVVSTTKTDAQTASLAPGAFATVTGLSATITPSSTSSNILVMLDVNGSGITDSRAHLVIRVKRGSTEIGSGAAASSRTTAFAALRINYSEIGNIVNASGTYLDSPATTSPITYSVEFGNATGGTRSFGINRSSNDTDTQSYVRASSTITIMEVSA